jgi:hypothetical protein
MGYYTVKVKPTIAASIQNAEAFASGEVLFDWTGFEIPKGSGKLVSATAIIKPKGDAAPTQNAFPFQLIFASNNDISLGTIGAAADRRPNPNITGMIEFPATCFGPTSMRSTAIASTSHSTVGGHAPLVIAPDVDESATAGFHKAYVGCIAAGNFNFTSINAVNETSFDAGAQTVITMDGSGMDVREHFAPGDVLHAQDDAVLGTVKTVDDDVTITLTAANTEAIAEDDIIFDVNPITLVLGFED